MVHTSETIRVCYFMERLMQWRRPVMLVGPAGSGKSVLVGAKLSSLNPEEYMVKNVPFNYYTTSAMLQGKQPQGLECEPLKGQQSSQGWTSISHSTASSLAHTYVPCPQHPLTLPPSSFLPVPYDPLHSIRIVLWLRSHPSTIRRSAWACRLKC